MHVRYGEIFGPTHFIYLLYSRYVGVYVIWDSPLHYYEVSLALLNSLYIVRTLPTRLGLRKRQRSFSRLHYS